MLSRSLLILAAFTAIAASTLGCSALTKPDEISISAEPLGAQAAAPAPQGVQPSPAQPIPLEPMPAKPPGSGG